MTCRNSSLRVSLSPFDLFAETPIYRISLGDCLLGTNLPKVGSTNGGLVFTGWLTLSSIRKEEKTLLLNLLQVTGALKIGAIVFNDVLGVTVVADTSHNRKYYLVDLSQSDGENPKNTLRVFFVEKVKKIILPPLVREPIWRVPEWLAPHSD